MPRSYTPPLNERSTEDLQKALVDFVGIYTRPNAWYAQQAWDAAQDFRAELARRKQQPQSQEKDGACTTALS